MVFILILNTYKERHCENQLLHDKGFNQPLLHRKINGHELIPLCPKFTVCSQLAFAQISPHWEYFYYNSMTFYSTIKTVTTKGIPMLQNCIQTLFNLLTLFSAANMNFSNLLISLFFYN